MTDTAVIVVDHLGNFRGMCQHKKSPYMSMVKVMGTKNIFWGGAVTVTQWLDDSLTHNHYGARIILLMTGKWKICGHGSTRNWWGVVKIFMLFHKCHDTQWKQGCSVLQVTLSISSSSCWIRIIPVAQTICFKQTDSWVKGYMSVFAQINYIQLNGPQRFNTWHFRTGKSLQYCLYSCTYREKHHDADSSHTCREKLSDVAFISTLREEPFLTFLWLHFVHVYLL